MKNIIPRNISLARTAGIHINPKYVNQAQSGKDNFEEDFKNSHVNTTFFQKVLLGVGSGIISITSPSRGDMIAVMGEVTGAQAFRYIQSKMQQSDEGRQILEEKPRISSGAVDLKKLNTYPPGTLGKAYSNFLNKYGYTPDSRNAVKFVDDLELAYVAQRYREVHDLFHTLLDMPTNMLGEVTVKWVEAIQTKLPMCAAGALFGSVRLAPKYVRRYSTSAIQEVQSQGIEKYKVQSEMKAFTKQFQLKLVSLPKPILNGILAVLKTSDTPRKVIFRSSVQLNNQLHCRRVPLEAADMYRIEKLLWKKFRETYPESVEDDQNIGEEPFKRLKNLLLGYVRDHRFNPITYNEAGAVRYLMCRSAAEYAVLRKVFNEIAVKDKDFSPVTYFDFGSGVGTAVWAAHDLWGNSLQEYICVDKSDGMIDVSQKVLQTNPEGEQLLKNIHYKKHVRKHLSCDIVVSAFSLFELPDLKTRLKTLTHLWNNTSKYLVLVETGTNEGFRLLLQARNYIVETSRKYGVNCYVFAPCPHESFCPRLHAPGVKLTPCNFKAQYVDVFNYNKRGEVGVELYSYLILKKDEEPLPEYRESRIVRQPHFRSGCITCQLCTNRGRLETAYITKTKYGKAVYSLFKFLQWGNSVPSSVNVEGHQLIDMKYVSKGDGLSNLLESKDVAKRENVSNEDDHENMKESNVDKGEYISDEDSESSDDSESSEDSDEDSSSKNNENMNISKSDNSDNETKKL